MKITILQTDIAWAQPAANITRVESLMRQVADSDLFVLPEMWATGFCVEPEGIAEDEERSVALQWMKDEAVRRQCAICGSLAVRLADGTYRNRHYFVTPSSVSFYDKRHLFSHGHETECFTRGNKAVTVRWGGFTLLLQTCYDLRFPVFSRFGIAGEYDVIVYVANWPEKRLSVWQTLIRARAIENQCYVVAANRTGDDPACHYAGASAIVDPLGRVLAEGTNKMETLTVTLDSEMLRGMRERFRVLDDRDACQVFL